MRISNLLRLPFRSSKSRTPARRRPEARRVRPQVEGLEDRRVMTVGLVSPTGSVLPNVEVVPIFYGSHWHTDAPSDVGYLTNFLQDLVNSPYMDMLTNAGYSDAAGNLVGRGSSTGAIFTSDGGTYNGQYEQDTLGLTPAANLSIPNPGITNATLTNNSIQGTLQWWIKNDGQFAGLQPDSNRLYVIFVEPGVEVSDPQPTGNPPVTTTWTSGNEDPNQVSHFYAYHDSFAGQDNSNHHVNIRYAVVPYEDGGIVNNTNPWLSVRDTLTEATSHEVAEAVTDPDNSGFRDNNTGKEIGDIVANEVVYQHGYAVQREADMSDQAMTPSDATAQRQVTFLVETTTVDQLVPIGGGRYHVGVNSTNELFERTPDGALLPVFQYGNPTTGIRSISDQGIDNYGQAMIDVVFNNGTAYEYHDSGNWVYLTNNVKDAKAGQGVSYVLDNSGNLTEYVEALLPNNIGVRNDPPPTPRPIDSNVVAIDAGTDLRGVNMVVATEAGLFGLPSNTYEISDAGYWNWIGLGLAQASAGRGGNVAYIDSSGEAWSWNEGSQVPQDLGSGAKKVTVGYTSDDGAPVLDVLFNDGTVLDGRHGGAPQFFTANMTDISKARGGIVDTIGNDGTGWEFPWVGDWFPLYTANGLAVAGGRTEVTAVA
jgi:hypothetical protein